MRLGSSFKAAHTVEAEALSHVGEAANRVVFDLDRIEVVVAEQIALQLLVAPLFGQRWVVLPGDMPGWRKALLHRLLVQLQQPFLLFRDGQIPQLRGVEFERCMRHLAIYFRERKLQSEHVRLIFLVVRVLCHFRVDDVL